MTVRETQVVKVAAILISGVVAIGGLIGYLEAKESQHSKFNTQIQAIEKQIKENEDRWEARIRRIEDKQDTMLRLLMSDRRK